MDQPYTQILDYPEHESSDTLIQDPMEVRDRDIVTGVETPVDLTNFKIIQQFRHGSPTGTLMKELTLANGGIFITGDSNNIINFKRFKVYRPGDWYHAVTLCDPGVEPGPDDNDDKTRVKGTFKVNTNTNKY